LGISSKGVGSSFLNFVHISFVLPTLFGRESKNERSIDMLISHFGESKTVKRSPILEVKNLTQIFPGNVVALDKINLKIFPKEIHAIIGENGAGKSTFCNIIAGSIKLAEGEMYYFGEKVNFSHPSEALRRGISIVYQERNLIPFLTGAQNICLNNEPNRFFIINEDRVNNLAEKVRVLLGVDVPLNIPVERLSPGQQQMIEIIRAFYYNPKILLLDEPTASLSESEVGPFLEFIQKLTNERDISIIFISHKIDEVFKIADKISVLTDGKKVFTKAKSETNPDECVKAMVKKELHDRIQVNSAYREEVPLLEVGKCYYDGRVHNLNLKVHNGEVVGMYGLVGSGRTECIEAIYGIRSTQECNIKFEGKNIFHPQPSEMIKKGVVVIPEEKSYALFSGLSLKKNMSISFLKSISSVIGLIDQNKEKDLAYKLLGNGNVKYSSIAQSIDSLSGGNKQKAIIARSLGLPKVKLIIMDEPTKGIDIGAKNEIYILIRKLAEEEKKAVLVISSELPELLNISDRLYIFYGGNIVKEFKRCEFDKTIILEYALGRYKNDRNK
jgi:ABC-type sugar transport system ATPase subunit